MSTPLLSGALNDLTRSQRRVAFQTLEGVPANLAADFADFKANGGPIIIEPAEVERAAISAGGAPSGALVGKYAIGGGPFAMGDVNPADVGQMRMAANVYGAYDLTNPVGGVNAYDFNLAGGTSAAEFLTVLDDNDRLPRTRFSSMKLGGYTLGADVNANLALGFPFQCPEYDCFGQVTQETGSGSDLPILKRTWGQYAAGAGTGMWAADGVDQDLWLRVDSVAAGVSVTFSTKITSGAAYSNQQTVAFGEFIRMLDESGARIGSVEEQPRVRFTETGLTALDEFKIPNRRARWAQSLPVEQPIASVSTIFQIGGDEVRTEGGWNVEAAWEVFELRLDVAGRQGGVVRRAGDLVVTITPTRDFVDLTLQEALLTQRVVSVVIDCFGQAEIAATGRNYRAIFAAPECRVFGSTTSVDEGGQNLDESVRLVARLPSSSLVYDGYTFDSHAHFLYETDATI